MSAFEIGPARPEEVARCPDIEARAARRFSSRDLPPGGADRVTDLETLIHAQREGRLLVARMDDGRTVAGFVLLEDHGDEAHLEEVDVVPECGRMGIGRALVEAACACARAQGFASITLSTFRDVAWNGPFYARAGFEEVARRDWTEALREAAAEEAAAGLDAERRVMMRRRLDGTSEA